MTAKLTFFLLDINSDVVAGRAEVRLWGVDEDGRPVLVRDGNFQHYFYLLPEENADVRKLLKLIDEKRSALTKIGDIRVEEKRYFGRPVEAIRVVCGDPEIVEKYASELKKIGGIQAHLEDDIRFATRYLIDNQVVPCGWHEAEVEPVEAKGLRVAKAYRALSTPRPIERRVMPKLKVMAFSTVCVSEKGSPKPWRDPTAIISIAASGGLRRAIVMEGKDDRPVIEEFVKSVSQYDPDIIVGYGCNKFDWPYLIERSSHLKVKLSVDRADTEPHTSMFGHISITGRSNLDLFDLAGDIPEIKIKTLDNVAAFFGVLSKPRETIVEEVDVVAYWQDPKLRETLVEYSAQNAELILRVAEANLDFAMQLSSLTNLPLDHVMAAAVGFRVDSYLMKEAYTFGELIPPRAEQPYVPYRGALVLEPRPGLHEKIAVLDFFAMYPNLMILFNISPDTLVRPGEKVDRENLSVIPEVKHRFRKQPLGFYNRVLTSLLEAREGIKLQLQKLDTESIDYKVLKAREKAVKVVTNAVYGYAGWIGARWYVREVAEAVTALGRQTILAVVKMAESMGLKVIYSDTDAIFVKYDKAKIGSLLRKVKEEFGMDIKPEKIYRRVLFTEAKKRYAGVLEDGSLDVVGLEVVRGDWSEVAKRLQEKVIEIVLSEGTHERAVDYVRQVSLELKAKRLPIRDLTIWKTLTKPIEEYEVRAPHVEVAKKLLKEGWELALGDKVGYVIEKGPGKLFEKARPYFKVKPEEIDEDYYINNQVLPAALRILEIFGVTKTDLLEGG